MLEILVIVLRKRELGNLLTQPENLTIILPGDNLVVCKSDLNDQLLFLLIFFNPLQIKPLKYSCLPTSVIVAILYLCLSF